MASIILTLCVIVILLIVLDLYIRSTKCVKELRKRPMNTLYPIVGNVGLLFADGASIFAFLRKCSTTHKQGFGFVSFGFTSFNAIKACEVEAIVSNVNNGDKNMAYFMMRPFLGRGLLTSSTSLWMKRRRILTPTFHFNILQKFLPIFTDESKKLIADIKTNPQDENGIVLQNIIPRFTLNTICETAMGVKLDDMQNPDEYRNTIIEIGQKVVKRTISPWFYPKITYYNFGEGKQLRKLTDVVHQFTSDVIQKRRQLNSNQINCKEDTDTDNIYTTTKQRYAMLDTLLVAEKDNLIDSTGIREEVDTFMFEGFDTTSNALTFAILMLGTHQQIQQEVYEEIIKVLQNRTGSDINISEYNGLNYLERVIKETLRLYPSVPTIGRKLGTDVTFNDNMVLSKGSNVFIHIFDLHRDPDVFKDPSRFDPDRFLPENIEKRNPYAYIPFSAGTRNCIGQKFAMLEIKTVLVDIVRNFRLEAITKVEDIVFVADMVMKCRDAIKVRFFPRR